MKKKWGVYLACAYLFFVNLYISHYALPSANVSNLFPFYDWNLFSFNRRYINWYFICIVSMDGKAIEPIEVGNNRDKFTGRIPFLVPHQIQRLGDYIANKGTNDPLTLAAKGELERNLFFDKGPIVYEVLKGTIDIRQVVYVGANMNLDRIGEYKYSPGAGK